MRRNFEVMDISVVCGGGSTNTTAVMPTPVGPTVTEGMVYVYAPPGGLLEAISPDRAR